MPVREPGGMGSPIKRPCQEKTLLHGKKVIFFLQGTHSAPGKTLFYPFRAPSFSTVFG
jgi:hypothetical protein